LHTREISAYGGVTAVMPRFAVFFMFMMLASVGLPGTSGFVGEMLVLVGAWKASSWVAFFAATGLVLGAAYMLWLFRRVMFGQVVHEKVEAMPAMERREFAIFVPLTILVLWFGVYPSSLLDVMEGSIQLVLDGRAASGVSLMAGK
jgi:NADH-quinone oxidoreductase subunit M